jgi:hypothetical protein
MERLMNSFKSGLIVSLLTLLASPAWARSITMKEGGAALWVFFIVGAVIILLQLIPAMILFFSFIGTTGTMIFKNGKGVKDEVLLHKPAPVKVKK